MLLRKLLNSDLTTQTYLRTYKASMFDIVLNTHLNKIINKNSEMFCKKVFLEHFLKFAGKHLYWSYFFMKLQI